MNRIWMIFVMLLLALAAAQASELYRWVDKDGKVHYGDAPPAENAERLNLGPGSEEAASGVSDTNIPYEAREASKNFPVTLYVAEKCGDICAQARAFLKKRRVPYSETVLKTQDEFDAFKQRSGTDNVPVLSVGRNWLQGFQPGAWASELDAAGYPK